MTGAPAGAGTVLVVEDEAGVRGLVRAVLERAGYRVLEAGDGREGVEAFGRHGPEVAAVLLDLTMPRLGGMEALAEIRRLRPDARVLLMSGYSEQEMRRRLAGLGGAPDATSAGFAWGGEVAGFVQKPFDAADLLAAVRRAIRPEG